MTEVQLLLWLTGIHVVGFVCVGLLMIPALRDNGDPPTGEDSGSSDDGWGNLPNGRPDTGGWPGGGIPLPDAEQSRIRLREPGRIGQRIPRPQRRPAREPARRPVRVTR
jgi:hypothetical protein